MEGKKKEGEFFSLCRAFFFFDLRFCTESSRARNEAPPWKKGENRGGREKERKKEEGSPPLLPTASLAPPPREIRATKKTLSAFFRSRTRVYLVHASDNFG